MLQLLVCNREGLPLAQSEESPFPHLDYHGYYREGDQIILRSTRSGFFAELALDDSMPRSVVYVSGTQYVFEVPCGEKHLAYSPKSFSGALHLLSARLLTPEETQLRRNLACNPYDWAGLTEAYPHASANIETRGEACFAARNVIDGIYANHFHGEWPFQSWGINRRADAQLRIDFGREVCVDELRLTLRCDFPHDNYWVQASVRFSDQSEETLSLVRSPLPQAFRFSSRSIRWLVLERLIPSEDPSPFPALTELEVWGMESEKK